MQSFTVIENEKLENMKEDKESPGTKIFIQVAGAVLTAVILYFIGINTSGEGAKVPEKETGMVIAETKEEVTSLAKGVSSNETPEKQTIEKNNVLETAPKITEVRKDDERHGLSMTGNVEQEDGKPAINAKITCNNCLTSNSPVFTDQAGRFKINYSIKCTDSEYPTKSLELTIFHQDKSYFASQSISQSSLTIDLK
jgi:hypothetical protein